LRFGSEDCVELRRKSSDPVFSGGSLFDPNHWILGVGSHIRDSPHPVNFFYVMGENDVLTQMNGL
jgi:hypothetical protein